MSKLQASRSKPIAIWLLVGVFMIIIQIILGGITRLTDSGLSITEWKPILGAVPPTSEQQWQQAFEQYKQIAQYKNLHFYFTLSDFKSIYFWEWMHRLWGRVIGIVFLIPFLIFLIEKRFSKEMIRPMVILFLLGGLQGLIGWLMVKSGLNDENLYVSHIRLAIHFIAALGLLVYTFWFALQLLTPAQQRVYRPASRSFVSALIVILVIQLIYGAFMAGLKAAPAAPTWPDINGSYGPGAYQHFGERSYSFASALVNSPLMVHFIHRNLAYLLTLLIVVWSFARQQGTGSSAYRKVRWLPLILVLVQVTLGVVTVLTSPHRIPQKWGAFEWNAQLHQFTAMLLLLSLVWVFFLLNRKGNTNSAGSIDPHVI
ncbi:MAG TPA: COX15/CtaA family protein [Flavisolibacter sp.]|jgi:cytochrome c oxidase assembly protein subunit 15|nr:COX15/CtaA family protein [Flavisolibacter sp.]